MNVLGEGNAVSQKLGHESAGLVSFDLAWYEKATRSFSES